MTKIDINIGGKKFSGTMPASWDDLSERELLSFYMILFESSKVPTPAQSTFTTVKMLSMSMRLLGLDMAQLEVWESTCIEQDAVDGQSIFFDELRQVMHSALAGLFDIQTSDEGVTTYATRFNLTRCPYPKITGMVSTKKAQWLYAPLDGLSNLTLYELAMTFTLYENYVRTGDESHANQLLGVLYRPKKPRTHQNEASGYGGDERQPLRGYEAKIGERAALMATIPTISRRLIIFWFASCRETIMNRYPKVFHASGGDPNAYGWGGVMLAVAGGPAGLDQISDQNFGNAMTWLSMKEDEARRLEAGR